MFRLTDFQTRLRGYGLAFGLGLAGGALFDWLNSPLPWFIGPMLANAIFAIAGAPVLGPNFLRPVALPVLGVVLGSAFVPEIFANASSWAISLAMIPLFIIVSTAVNFTYFRKMARQDKVTAYLSSVPAGLNDMVLLGDEYGGDTRQIALAHAMRIMISVIGIAALLVLVKGVSGSAAPRPVLHVTDLSLKAGLILAGCAVLGPTVGRLLRLPAKAMLGALLLSAAAHLSGLVHDGPPTLFSLAAQLVLGSCIGARFAGVPLASAALSLLHGLVSALLSISVSASVATLAVIFAGLDYFEALLGYSPGGLMEMSLLALAINQSVAYVTIAHTARYVFVMFAAVFLFHRLQTRA